MEIVATQWKKGRVLIFFQNIHHWYEFDSDDSRGEVAMEVTEAGSSGDTGSLNLGSVM